MTDSYHKLILQWHDKYLDHRIEKVPIPYGYIPDGFGYNYFSNTFIESLGYYDSEFLCPFCTTQTADDGSPLYTILYKLDINTTKALIGNQEIELKRLFTCPQCRAFYATVISINGEKLHGRSGGAPFLDEFAAFTPMYPEDAWIDIVEQTKSLTSNPSVYNATVVDPAFIKANPAFAVLQTKDSSPLSEARKKALLSDAIEHSCTKFLAYTKGELPRVYIHKGDIENAHVLMDKVSVFHLIDELFETNVINFLETASESTLNEWNVQRLKEIIHSIAFDYCEEGERVYLEDYIKDDKLIESLKAVDWNKESPNELLEFMKQ